METLRYEAPDSIEAATALLAGEDGITRVLAGGTDVLVQLHADLVEPVLLVDVKKIPELTAIEKSGGSWTFGAAVSGMDLMDNADFCTDWPGIIDGVKLIGSMQIKGRASVGGNLCNASPAADSVPAMMAAGAVANIIGPKGARELPVEDVPAGPGKTNLDKGEIIVSFALPERPAHSGDAYLRFIPRTEMDIAVVGAGINLSLDGDGTCTEARVAIGAVAPTALMVPDAAAALVGSKVDDEAMSKMSAAVSAACNPIDDKRGTVEYRTKVAGVMAERACAIALERARQN